LLGDYSSNRFTSNPNSLADVFSIISIIFTYTKAAMELCKKKPTHIILRGNHESEDQISNYINMNLAIEKFGLNDNYTQECFQKASNRLLPFIAAFKFEDLNLLLSHSLYADNLWNAKKIWEKDASQELLLKQCMLKNTNQDFYNNVNSAFYPPLTCWSSHYLRHRGEERLIISEKNHNEYIKNLFDNDKKTYNIVGHNNKSTYDTLSKQQQEAFNKVFGGDDSNMLFLDFPIEGKYKEYTTSTLDAYKRNNVINLMVPSALPVLEKLPQYFTNPIGYKVLIENNKLKKVERVELNPL
jgi:hypothetical protein